MPHRLLVTHRLKKPSSLKVRKILYVISISSSDASGQINSYPVSHPIEGQLSHRSFGAGPITASNAQQFDAAAVTDHQPPCYQRGALSFWL